MGVRFPLGAIWVVSSMARPSLKLVYYEACQNKEKAIEREKYFKTGFGRRFLKNRLYDAGR